MKNTKIICTIGPSSKDYNTLLNMYKAGMNVARINLSHGLHEDHQLVVNEIKKLRKDLASPLGIMFDTKGPEIRIKTFKNGKETITQGQTFTFTTNEVEGTNKIVSINYPDFHKYLNSGNSIFVNDGQLQFTVVEVKDNDVICKCENDGIISNRKSVFVPNVKFNLNFISEADKTDLLFAIKNDADYIAASYSSNAGNIIEMRNFLTDNGLTDCRIIAKIENQEGLDNIDDILHVADGIMVARGDLGVEIAFYRVPKAQKELIAKAKNAGKEVIVATEMLDSMTHNLKPTRAEVSDVANAIYDETSAVMLSGETATGVNPVRVVQTMANIVTYIENNIDYYHRFQNRFVNETLTTDTIAHSACSVAMQLKAKAILVSTESGKTSRAVSKFRPSVPILALVLKEKTYHQLSLSWGVNPVYDKKATDLNDLLTIGNDLIKKMFSAQANDTYVTTAGLPLGEKGSTNLLLVEKIV